MAVKCLCEGYISPSFLATSMITRLVIVVFSSRHFWIRDWTCAGGRENERRDTIGGAVGVVEGIKGPAHSRGSWGS